MGEAQRRLAAALLAVPESTASALYGMHDLLSSVGRDWNLLVRGVAGPARVAPRIVAADADPFRNPNGVRIEPDAAIADIEVPALVCVSDLQVTPRESFAGRYRLETAWLRRCHAAGAMLASAGSGVLLLAEAGLLDGGEATTHWGFCDAMRKTYPHVRLRPGRALVASGEGQRVVTADGGSSWLGLALYLIARLFGPDEAIRVARLHLVDRHALAQLPLAMSTCARRYDDAKVAACQAWIADHYAEPAPVAGMAAMSGLALRSFERRFARVTGLAPLEYVHTLRVEEGKQLLEATDLPVEAIANQVGYEDAGFFGRLFRRKVGMTPTAYRRSSRVAPDVPRAQRGDGSAAAAILRACPPPPKRSS